MVKLSQAESDQCDISKIFGLVTCTILPPNVFHIPILPVRHDNKLYFPLCSLCMTVKNEEYCNHSDEERAFTGTWGSPELLLAKEHGYKILR